MFGTIAFAGTLPTSLIVQPMLSGCLFKVAYLAAATPLTYAAVALLNA